jgi:hypothetical protein
MFYLGFCPRLHDDGKQDKKFSPETVFFRKQRLANQPRIAVAEAL